MKITVKKKEEEKKEEDQEEEDDAPNPSEGETGASPEDTVETPVQMDSPDQTETPETTN